MEVVVSGGGHLYPGREQMNVELIHQLIFFTAGTKQKWETDR
jgi:hypothetical protein